MVREPSNPQDLLMEYPHCSINGDKEFPLREVIWWSGGGRKNGIPRKLREIVLFSREAYICMW